MAIMAIDGSNFLMAQTAGVYRSTGIWFVKLTLINTINNYPLQLIFLYCIQMEFIEFYWCPCLLRSK